MEQTENLCIILGHHMMSVLVTAPYLPTVYLEIATGDLQLLLFEFRRIQVFEHILCSQCVNAVLGVLCFPVELSSHRVGLS